jgi:DNA-binding NarL/FixJ family response regulator
MRASYVKVLLVEDSPVVRDEVRKLLEQDRAVTRVRAVPTVESAREELEGDGFDVWLLDFRLPDGTALDLLGLREAGSDSPRQVVVMSNYATRLVRRRCLEAGADHFLDKALDFEELPDLVTAAGSGEEEPG